MKKWIPIVATLLVLFFALTLHAQAVPSPSANVQTQQLTLLPKNPVPTPTQVTITSSITGPATYDYWIVTHSGSEVSAPAGPYLASSAPSSLGGIYSNSIVWMPAVSGATYDLLRTTTSAVPSGACACAVATALTSTSFTDGLASTTAYTVSTTADQGTLTCTSSGGCGVPYITVSPSSAYPTLAVALAACPPAGCVIFDSTPETWNVNPFASLGTGVSAEVHLMRGTWTTNASIVVPNKTQLYGSGRGDANANGTVIQAGGSFPSSTAVIQFGSSAPSFGIRVSNLLVECNNVSGAIGVQNQNAQEQSGVDFLTIHNCPASELSVSGAAAQNSGPYRNLEIYNDAGCTHCGASTVPINIGTGISALRGIEDVTINDNGTSTNPNVALEWDAGNGGSIQNLHIEYAAAGVQVGANGPVTGLNIANVECGPSPTVPKCINISASNSVQAYTIQNVFTASGTLLTDNQYSGPFTSGSDTGLSLYAVGVGAIASRPRLYQSDSGIVSLLGSLAMLGGLNMNGQTISDGSTSNGISIAAQGFAFGGVAFASLPTSPVNGTIVYCNNCTVANPCASGGTGAFAKRLNAVWVCN